MLQLIYALVPVFALIIIGHILQRLAFPGPGFWETAERLTYYVLFPVMLVFRLGQANISPAALADTGLLILSMLACMTLLLILLQRVVRWPGASFTSVFQGAVRFNSFVGLAAVMALMGESGLSLAAMAAAIMIPLLNVLCIVILTRYAVGIRPGWSGTLRQVATNPLILGSLGGLLVSQLGTGFHPILAGICAPLSDMALPMGLMTVGAGLQLRSLRRAGPMLVAALGLKLLFFPLLTAGLAWLLGVEGRLATVVILLSALPTASSSYILARQMGGDGPLMAAIISAQTLLAMLTLPLVLMWLGNLPT